MVGVEVADDDRVELARVASGMRPRITPWPQSTRIAVETVSTRMPDAGRLRLRSGRACPDDRDAGHGETDSLSIAGIVARAGMRLPVGRGRGGCRPPDTWRMRRATSGSRMRFMIAARPLAETLAAVPFFSVSTPRASIESGAGCARAASAGER